MAVVVEPAAVAAVVVRPLPSRRSTTRGTAGSRRAESRRRRRGARALRSGRSPPRAGRSTWPSPRCSRSSVDACHSARCGAVRRCERGVGGEEGSPGTRAHRGGVADHAGDPIGVALGERVEDPPRGRVDAVESREPARPPVWPWTTPRVRPARRTPARSRRTSRSRPLGRPVRAARLGRRSTRARSLGARPGRTRRGPRARDA